MKKKRQDKILEIIEKEQVTTQEMLKQLLEDEGITVTQATLSRDINELDLKKQTVPSGANIYVKLPKPDIQLSPIFKASVTDVGYSMNMVVIKCSTGMAQAVCATLDKMGRSEILGTIAGDDTIFALMKSEKDAEEFTKELRTVLTE